MKNYPNLNAYNGTKPYIFVSYSHADAQQVLPAIEAMQEKGYRIWFDMGIEAGTEWSNNIAQHLRDCDTFVFFVSHNSAVSENCLDEVAYAKSNQKPSLMIFLEENVVLPEGTEMQTARFQRMYFTRHSSVESAVAKISESSILASCREEDYLDVPAAPVLPKAPKAYNHAKDKPKKRVGLWIGLAIGALLIVGIIVAGILLLGGKKEPTVPPEVTTTLPTDPILPTSPSAPEVLTLSDDLMEFTFALSGKVFQLPCSFSSFTSEGWTISSSGVSSESILGGLAKLDVDVVNNGKEIELVFYNPSGNAQPLKDCLVGGVCVEASDNADFCVAKWINPSATEQEVLNAFGVPTSRYEGSSYVSLSYSSNDNNLAEFCIYYGDSTRYSSIELNNFLPATEQTETNSQRPAYLDDYVVPTALGTDATSGVFELEGKLYNALAPLSEYLDDGWTIASGPSSLASYCSDYLTLKCDGKKLQVSVLNGADYQTTIENCVVYSVCASADDGVSFKLPNGIDMSYTGSQVATAMSEIVDPDDVYEGSYATNYYAYSENYRLVVSVDNETGMIYDIQLDCTSV